MGEPNATGTPNSAPVRILIVCTANQCRSPIAEHLLRATAAAVGASLRVKSAGTDATEGLPMHPNARQVLAEHGITPGEWITSRLSPALIEGADLILTAGIDHRRTVVLSSPPALRRAFTFLEWARLAPLVGSLYVNREDFRTILPARVAAARGSLQPTDRSDDVEDPIGQRYQVFQQTGDIIAHAVSAGIRPFVPAKVH